jgi:serine/threonine-protein kinase RsbW
MTSIAQQYEIEFASLAENIIEVEQFVDGLKDKLQISDNLYGNLLISLTEAVNNAIIHGNGLNADKKVKVLCKKENNVISFIITDEGEGFDYNNLPDPTDPNNIEKLTGRGVFLMKQLSDQLIFSKGGSQVELQFKN